MHKQLVLLTRAKTRQEAHSIAERFLEDYINYSEDKFFDEYIFGGRYTGRLNPLIKEFEEKASELACEDIDFYRELRDENIFTFEEQEVLDDIWKELGGKEENPWDRDTFGSTDYEDDVLNLSICSRYVTEHYIDSPQIDAFNKETNVYDIDNRTSNIANALANAQEYYAVNVHISY